MSTTPENQGAQAQTLEERMKIALQRLIAAETEEDKGTARISYQLLGAYNDPNPFYASIGSAANGHFAFAPTPEAATDQLIAIYGTPESRRTGELSKLRAAAEKLGYRITKPESPEEGGAQ